MTTNFTINSVKHGTINSVNDAQPVINIVNGAFINSVNGES